MKTWNNIKMNLSGIGRSVSRYPATILWLIGLAGINAAEIQKTFDNYDRWVFTCLLGAMLGVAAEHLFERFFEKSSQRWLLHILSSGLAVLYHFLLADSVLSPIAYSVRTLVLLFALYIASIWIPSIEKRHLFFHQVFLVNLKAGLAAILFSVVLTLGLAAIVSAADLLLFNINYRVYSHIFNLVWVLFAPLYFLSLLPVYSRKDEELDASQAVRSSIIGTPFSFPRFLEILFSYVIIPLLAIYTVILLLYIALNISGRFWSDNLLEPLLVSFAVTVIIIYLVVCNLDNRIAYSFRKFFPKIMLPIVLFQTIASVLKIQDTGLTHGRYYVIMFGVFAIVASIIFSFFPPSKNGWIAVVLLVLSFVSITPPIDAFTIAGNSQANLLEQILLQNKMLENNEIKPNEAVSHEDKVRITRSLTYLYDMDEVDRAPYLADSFQPYSNDMQQVFGFPLTYPETRAPEEYGKTAYLDWESLGVIPVDKVDYLLRVFLNYNEEGTEKTTIGIPSDEEAKYVVKVVYTNPYFRIDLLDADEQELLSVPLDELFEKAFAVTAQKEAVSRESMTLVKENEKAKVEVIAMSLDEFENNASGDIFLFIQLKE